MPGLRSKRSQQLLSQAKPVLLFRRTRSLALDLVGQRPCVIQGPQGMSDSSAINSNSSIGLVVVHESADEALDIPVKYYSDEVSIPVDDGRPRVTADDVAGAHEIERRRQIQ